MAGALTCPEGYACPHCYAAPQLCPRGYYSDAGALECTVCPAGSKCPTPFGSDKESCASGYYAAQGSVNCYPVPQHMSTSSTADRPTWCAWGQVSKITDNSCQNCAENYWCPADNVDPLECPKQIDAGSTYAFTSRESENNCFALTATYGAHPSASNTGEWQTTTNFDTLVAAGHYVQLGSSVQYECPNGMECNFPMENIYVQCPPGYYDPDDYFGCVPCPEGKVCPVMTHQYIQNNGNNGWVQDGFFSPMGTHVELRTPAGWYVQTTTYFKEVRPCPLGYYSPDGTIDECTQCPVGYMCPYGSNDPILCMEGASAESLGMHECTPCTDTQWYNPDTKTCDTVTDDFYTFHPIFAQQDCVYNQRSSATSFPDSSFVDCEPQDGQYFIKNSNSYANCPAGFYCMEQGQATAYIKIPCPPGTYQAGSGPYQKIEDACILCEAGNYCPGGDNAKTTCPAGYICPEGTQFATQFPCPLFSLNANTGASTYD